MISSILPFSSKRKSEKISSSDIWEKHIEKIEHNSGLTENPSVDTFTTKKLEDIVEEDPIMKRLSIVVGEIEEFEREFVHPVRKTVSSSNVFKTSYHRHPTSHLKSMYKYSSVQTLCGKLPSSSSSVISDYDSGAFSRESTPDFSLMSSIPDVSEASVNQCLRIPYNQYSNTELEETVHRDSYFIDQNMSNAARENNPKNTPLDTSSKVENKKCKENKFDTIVNNSSLFSSTSKTKKKNSLSKSDSLLWARTPTILRRSATSVGCFPTNTSENSVKNNCEGKHMVRRYSLISRSATLMSQETFSALKRSATSASIPSRTTLPCAVVCNPEVTVNGLHYHLCE